MPSTCFAPAERTADKDLERHIGYFSDGEFVQSLLNALPSVLLILNPCRQIVFANAALLSLIGLDPADDVLGLRPGEVMNCKQLEFAPSGCGTGPACADCGAVLSILDGLGGKKAVRECRMSRLKESTLEDLDLLVWSTPFVHQQEKFTVCSFTDISNQKRRNALEKIFFHDILNVAGGIKGFAEMLTSHSIEDIDEALALINSGAGKIINQVQSQQLLLAAENNELKVARVPVRLSEFLQQQVQLYRAHEVCAGRTLELESVPDDEFMITDPMLLERVLGNMLKNGLEAIQVGETVRVGCHLADESVNFWVHNPGVIPLGVQFQLFHRSYSSKGGQRGLGTYSMRLLSGFLDGHVSFESTAGQGTIFTASYPRHLD